MVRFLTFAALLFSLALSACKSHAPAATAPHREPAPEAVQAPQPDTDAPLGDPFAQPEDQADDPADALNALKHNCCDEMPADQVKALIREQAESPKAARPARQH